MDPRCCLLLGTELHPQKRKRQRAAALPLPGLGKLVAVFPAKTSFTLQPIPPDSFWISQGILDIPGWFSQPSWPGISQCSRARCSCWGHPLRNTHTHTHTSRAPPGPGRGRMMEKGENQAQNRGGKSWVGAFPPQGSEQLPHHVGKFPPHPLLSRNTDCKRQNTNAQNGIFELNPSKLFQVSGKSPEAGRAADSWE